jgi:ElaB/YqjD/DUF883 family membrane-anchored ribosome-binding protein
MDNETADIRQDIEATQVAMAKKMKTLERRARQTVNEAKTAVQHTVDLNYQVRQRPWPMVGVAVLMGYTLRRLLSPVSSHRGEGRVLIIEVPTERARPLLGAERWTGPETSARTTHMCEREEPEDGGGRYANELSVIKGAAIGAVVDVVRDLVKLALPTVASSCKKAPPTTSPRKPDSQSSAAPE